MREHHGVGIDEARVARVSSAASAMDERPPLYVSELSRRGLARRRARIRRRSQLWPRLALLLASAAMLVAAIIERAAG
jgi:hypothetical protein